MKPERVGSAYRHNMKQFEKGSEYWDIKIMNSHFPSTCVWEKAPFLGEDATTHVIQLFHHSTQLFIHRIDSRDYVTSSMMSGWYRQ